MPQLLLQLNAIEKSFGGVQALKPIQLALAPGETLGLIGENGAGKSTLIKILSGVHRPDAGRLLWQGKPVSFQSPRDALAAGIGAIHQELAFFSHLSVAENLLLGEEWPRRWWRGVDWNLLHRRAGKLLSQFELPVSTRDLFIDLSSAQKQEIAIARALSRKAQLLILDEPTASLGEPEVHRLFSHLRRLRAEGVAILYVSHRLDEILQLTDRVAVLRDGELVATYPTAEANVPRMVRDMVGRPLDQIHQRHRKNSVGAPLLELQGVSREELFHNISFSVHSGEIVGLAGLVGAGRSELARAIYGLYPWEQGSIRLCGQDWKPSEAHQSLRAGLAYLPEERKRQSLVLDHSVHESISIGFSDLMARWNLVPREAERVRTANAIKKYGIKTSHQDQEIGNLSGGNQQKAILARWLDRDPKVLILDEPTRGVDVGAKAEIYALIDQLAENGKSILLISSDLPEVIGLSDRVLVMHAGSLSAELKGAEITQENIVLAASGIYGRHTTP